MDDLRNLRILCCASHWSSNDSLLFPLPPVLKSSKRPYNAVCWMLLVWVGTNPLQEDASEMLKKRDDFMVGVADENEKIEDESFK